MSENADAGTLGGPTKRPSSLGSTIARAGAATAVGTAVVIGGEKGWFNEAESYGKPDGKNNASQQELDRSQELYGSLRPEAHYYDPKTGDKLGDWGVSIRLNKVTDGKGVVRYPMLYLSPKENSDFITPDAVRRYGINVDAADIVGFEVWGEPTGDNRKRFNGQEYGEWIVFKGKDEASGRKIEIFVPQTDTTTTSDSHVVQWKTGK